MKHAPTPYLAVWLLAACADSSADPPSTTQASSSSSTDATSGPGVDTLMTSTVSASASASTNDGSTSLGTSDASTQSGSGEPETDTASSGGSTATGPDDTEGLVHGEPFTIDAPQGVDFGSKVPAEPYLWADFDDLEPGTDVDGYVPTVGPPILFDQIGGDGTPLSGTAVDAQQRSDHVTTTVHLDADPAGTRWGIRVRVEIDRTAGDDLYYFFWQRQDFPSWQAQGDTLNQKPIDIYNSSFGDVIYTGYADSSASYRSGGAAAEDAIWSQTGLSMAHADTQWVGYEEEIRVGGPSSGSRQSWAHRDAAGEIDELWDEDPHGTWRDADDDYRWLTVGEYFRQGPWEGWVELLYVDYTFARVMLGDAATLDACTRLEIQRPVEWAPESVTAVAYLGTLDPNATAYAYAYVRRDDGTWASETGIPVRAGARR